MSSRYHLIDLQAKIPLIIGMLLLLALAPMAGAQNLLLDPGFEEVTVISCFSANLFPDDTPWYQIPYPSALGSPDVFSVDCPTLPGAPPSDLGLYDITAAHGGIRFMGAGSLSPIRETFGQTLAVPLTEGESYRLSGYFTHADPSYAGPGYLEVWMTDVVGVDDVKVGEIGEDAPVGEWGERSIEFEAPANASIIYITGIWTDPNFPVTYIACDDLILEFDDTIAVESGTWSKVKGLYR